MVFQDPFASLNPYMRLQALVAEPMRNFDLAQGGALGDRVAHLFDRVHLPRSFTRRSPHELGDGQRQRAAIPRALAADPRSRRMQEERAFRSIASPVRPVGHDPDASVYDELAPGQPAPRGDPDMTAEGG